MWLWRFLDPCWRERFANFGINRVDATIPVIAILHRDPKTRRMSRAGGDRRAHLGQEGRGPARVGAAGQSGVEAEALAALALGLVEDQLAGGSNTQHLTAAPRKPDGTVEVAGAKIHEATRQLREA